MPAPPDLPERRLLRKVFQQLYECLHEHHIHEVACQSRVTRLFRKQICHSASHFTPTTSSPSQASPARLVCTGCPCELRLVCFVATSVCNSAVRWFPSNLCGRRAGLIKNCCDGVNTCASEMSQAKFSVNLLQPQNHGTNHTWQAHMPPHLAIVFPETQSHNPVSGAYESLLCLATIMF